MHAFSAKDEVITPLCGKSSMAMSKTLDDLDFVQGRAYHCYALEENLGSVFELYLHSSPSTWTQTGTHTGHLLGISRC